MALGTSVLHVFCCYVVACFLAEGGLGFSVVSVSFGFAAPGSQLCVFKAQNDDLS